MKEKKFNELSKTLRKNRNFTIEDTAKLLGFSEDYLNRIELGEIVITDEIIDKYMDLFDFKEEQVMIAESYSSHDIDYFINGDYLKEKGRDDNSRLITFHFINDPKMILDVFATCQDWGYNFQPGIMSSSSEYVAQFFTTIIDYRKRMSNKKSMSHFDLEEYELEARISLGTAISEMREKKCAVFIQKSGFLCNSDSSDDFFNECDAPSMMYYPLISIVREDSFFIVENELNSEKVLKMPADLILPYNSGFDAYDIP